MQCPTCLEITVASAVFCNFCGTRMPLVCPDCHVDNPPESRFCHRCGNSLPVSNSQAVTPRAKARETGIRDIGVDLKTLSIDVAAYSAPRIKRGSIVTARGAKALAAYSFLGIKSLAQRLKPDPVEPPASSGNPTNDVVADTANLHQPSSGPAVACPRCNRISEPGSLFCFSCGLPLDDSESAATQSAVGHASQGAGFGRRFWGWVIDFVVLTAVQMVLIAAWPGFDEYFASDTRLHWVDLLGLVASIVYYTVAVSAWATTIGKRSLGMYVLRPDSSKVGPGRALARYFAGILSMLIFGVGYLMIALRSDQRGLHDLICDTVVVRK